MTFRIIVTVVSIYDGSSRATGYLGQDINLRKDANATVAELTQKFDQIEGLTLEADDEVIVMGHEVLKHSFVSFKIQESSED